jgi:hypothetical protein
MSLSACYQKLSPWLYSPLDRSGRVYLENHLELLDAESDEFLELFIAQYREKPAEQERLRLARHIVRHAIEQGRTTEAVRESYVNVFGGLILDLPTWLQAVEQEWMPLLSEPWTDRRATLGKLRLRDAIERARLDPGVAPTTRAELQFLLGNLFAGDLCRRPTDTFETMVACYTAALQVYTVEHYPLRHAKILLTLGDVYRRQAADQRTDLLLQAARYYWQALSIYGKREPA